MNFKVPGQLKVKTSRIALRRFANWIAGILYPGCAIIRIHDYDRAFDDVGHYKNLYNEIIEKASNEIIKYEKRGGFAFNSHQDTAQLIRHIIGMYK